MRVDCEPDPQKPGYIKVTPYGPIDSDTYLEFQGQLQTALSQHAKIILLDMAQVDYISSLGLGVLITAKKSLRAAGGDLLFCNLKAQIRRLFEIVKALPQESLFQSVEEADRYFYDMMNRVIEAEKKKGGEAQ